MIHKNKNRPPAHVLSETTRKKIIALKETKYEKANFSHFTELLAEHEGLVASRSSIQRLLTTAGIKSPKKHRKRKLHHRRKRKEKTGLLVQIDASPHPWLGGKERYSLHGAIDDATGAVLGLYLSRNECLNGYFELMRVAITDYGIPVQLYADRHAIFFVPKRKDLSLDEQLAGKVEKLTQFGRAMDELGVRIIPASSPQAKGRIERLWETLQSRLPIELQLNEIDTAEAANAFFPEFLFKFNRQFAVKPLNPDSAFSILDDRVNLDYILCIKEERKLDGNHTFSFKGRAYQLNAKNPVAPPRAKVAALYSPKFGVMAAYQGEVYPTISVVATAVKQLPVKTERPQLPPVKPASDHPWNSANRALFYDQSDSEILEALFNSTLAWR